VSDYRGQRAALATGHAKESVITPPFASLLGLAVAAVPVDTDSFGTFAGEIPRAGSAYETAVRKARDGMAASGLPLGLASEGTIASDPVLPGVTVDMELLVFIDDVRGIVVHETHRSSATIAGHTTVSREDDLDPFLDRADFPRHGLIARPAGLQGPIAKGITDHDDLRRIIDDYAALSPTHRVEIESDLRAHMSPSRMMAIDACAHALAERLATPCPNCGCPGWGPMEPAWGLPCRECGTTAPHVVRADRMGCPRCPAFHEAARHAEFADPQWCPRCNP
jgi:hypothetical protein